MAEIHVARLNLMRRTADGKFYNASSPKSTNGDNISVRDALTMSTEIRVMADSTIPNTANYPNVKTYLEAEAASGFLLAHLDQTYVITQKT